MLENPPSGSIQSGISVVSGWKCAAGTLTARFDGGPDIEIPYGSDRYDTMGSCDDANNGFGLLINYNDLGDGSHIVAVYDDGELFYASEFSVATLGTPFLAGVNATCEVSNFPGLAETTLLRWNEATQSFVIESISDFAPPPPPPTSDTFTGWWHITECFVSGSYCNDWVWQITHSGSLVSVTKFWSADEGYIACLQSSSTDFSELTVSGRSLSGRERTDTTSQVCGYTTLADFTLTLSADGETMTGYKDRFVIPECDLNYSTFWILSAVRTNECS